MGLLGVVRTEITVIMLKLEIKYFHKQFEREQVLKSYFDKLFLTLLHITFILVQDI